MALMRYSNGGLSYNTIMKMPSQEYGALIMAVDLLNKPQTKANKLYKDKVLEQEYREAEAELRRNQAPKG